MRLLARDERSWQNAHYAYSNRHWNRWSYRFIDFFWQGKKLTCYIVS